MTTFNYAASDLVEIEKYLSQECSFVELSGKNLTIPEIISVAYRQINVKLTANEKILNRITSSHQAMISDIIYGIPVYGSNTSYGGQAGRVLNKGEKEKRLKTAKELSEALVFLDVGSGKQISKEIIKSAMLIRINMLMQGVSGVRLKTLEIIKSMINKNLIPVVNEYGGVGASGDLIHNQRIISAARGLANVKVMNEKNKIETAYHAMKRHKIPFLNLDPKEGLALVNGDNFSTAYAVLSAYKLTQYFLISTVIGALVVELLKGTDRSFHPLLAAVRPHAGQAEIASIYRFLLKNSNLAYQEMLGHQVKPNGIRIQDNYSLRCLAQFQGVYVEMLKNSLSTISTNANSVSDNPLWVPPELTCKNEKPWQWVSGGNFLAMHMVEALDSMRKITTQLVKLHDRHLSRLVEEVDNNGMPANLSDLVSSITHCSFKGVQIQTGMFEVYSTFLANPIATLFGIHEERNQDITSHATTSGILTLANLDLLKYTLANMLLSLAQGVDLRGGPKLLSPKTRKVYNLIREYCHKVTADRPLFVDIEKIAELLDNGTIIKLIRNEIFSDYKS